MFLLSEETKKQIDHWLTKYPPDQRRSAVVASLLIVQSQNNGYLSEEAMKAVAQYLSIPPIEVYEVATFYDMYHLKPIGKHKISVCTNISCFLRGSDEIVNFLKQKLGIGFNETTPDGFFTLKESECLAACGGAPICQLNDKIYLENLTVDKMNQLIDDLTHEKFHVS